MQTERQFNISKQYKWNIPKITKKDKKVKITPTMFVLQL